MDTRTNSVKQRQSGSRSIAAGMVLSLHSKFHTRVAAFRKYLREQASSPEEEELIAAKMVGRWRSVHHWCWLQRVMIQSLGADWTAITLQL